ncbi:MAG: hypothetical protein JWP75_963 [Frondihabitans sp.]|nr:hypothetical protein [Frondihabitans sp.]
MSGVDFASVPLLATRTLVIVDVIAAILVVILFVRPRRRGHWRLVVLLSLVVGAALGGVTVWYVGDVQNAFGVSPTWVDRIWVGAVFAGICLALVNVVLAGWIRKIVAVVALFVFVVAGGLAINRDVGEYLTPGQLLGTTTAPDLSLPKPLIASGTGSIVSLGTQFNPFLYRTWHPPITMPKVGTVGQITIPATVSHFDARKAWVYMPPAALVRDAPALPVVVLMSGQPASPGTVMVSGNIPSTLDAMAAKNHGLAPIVVVPDQLGPSEGNPMCVNGKLGNSATYLTVDVPNWIRTHLHVEADRRAWVVGGFSQGGTCSLQFATGDPKLFGSFIDVAGEEYPTLATDAQAVSEGFAGNAAAFDRAKPVEIMRAHSRYPDTVGFFAVGQDDTKYGQSMRVTAAAAESAGIKVVRDVIVGSGHDWTTATNGFASGLGYLFPRLGLASGVQKP